MKKLNSIKLNGLNKSNLELREMSHIYGGNYCAFGDDNLKANEGQGKCSCYCSFSNDYYSATGLSHEASHAKATTSF